MDDNTKALVDAVRRDIIDSGSWTNWPGGWPGQIELCLTDAIYSANAIYGSPGTEERGPTGVHKVLDTLRSTRQTVALDDLPTLVTLLRNGETPVLGNHQHSPGTSVLKELNLLRIAEAFVAVGVRSSTDLDEYLGPDRNDGTPKPWWPRHPEFGRVAGVADQTWEYFLMLAGYSGVKADRMIRRYVARAIYTGPPTSSPPDVAPEPAARLVRSAAAQLSCKPHEIDHAIWAYESGNVRPN